MSTTKRKHTKKKGSPLLPTLLLSGIAAVLLGLILMLGNRLPPVSDPPPTLPNPEPNPYLASDFAYEGSFLTCTVANTRLGIDVSEHQSAVDWETVKEAGVEYVMIRAGYRGYTEGQLFRDSCFDAHLAGAQAAGLDVGVYFFSQAVTAQEAEEEALFLLSILDETSLEMGVAFDWEYVSDEARTAAVDGATMTDCAVTFCELIAREGYDPLVYFNQHQAQSQYDLEALSDYGFWLAMYSDEMTFPYRVDHWQYTETGTVPGVPGETDINLYLP